jgi:hypothetical protein
MTLAIRAVIDAYFEARRLRDAIKPHLDELPRVVRVAWTRVDGAMRVVDELPVVELLRASVLVTARPAAATNDNGEDHRTA